MVHITPLLFLLATASTAISSPLLQPRSFKKLQSDLTTLNTDYKQARAADIADADGKNSEAVQKAVDKISRDTLKATADAKASGPLSAPDSKTLNSYINETLEPSIKGAIQATIANKDQIAKDGFTSVVASELEQAKTETDDFGKALGMKEPSGAVQKQLRAAIAKIDADYDAGIAAFSS